MSTKCQRPGAVHHFQRLARQVVDSAHARQITGAGAVSLFILLVLLGVPAAQEGGSGATSYTFTTILDSQRDGLSATRCAAINASGTVAVQVRDEALEINKLITKRAADDAPVVVADTQSTADFPTFCDNGITSIPSDPSINAKGEVAFQGNLRRLTTREECGTPEQRQRRQAVLLGRNGPLSAIAHTINPPGGNFISEFLVADQSVNNTSRVAIVPELDNGDSGLFVGRAQKPFETRFLDSAGQFDTPSSRVSLNEQEQIAFEDSGIIRSNPDGTFTTIVGPDSDLSGGDVSLNNLGRVAFQGSTFVDDTQILGIFTGDGGPITVVADSTGPFSSFDEPSLNDLGKVVFTADLDEFGPDGRQIQGVFTGPDPVADKVLQAGELYDGVTISSIRTCSEALNNDGEIVMTVQSENPDTFEVRTFVVKATPNEVEASASVASVRIPAAVVLHALRFDPQRFLRRGIMAGR
jgi:hypothetical protein